MALNYLPKQNNSTSFIRNEHLPYKRICIFNIFFLLIALKIVLRRKGLQILDCYNLYNLDEHFDFFPFVNVTNKGLFLLETM